MHELLSLAFAEVGTTGSAAGISEHDNWDLVRIVGALSLAGLLIFIANRNMLHGLKPDASNTGNFVAFCVLAATILGAAAVGAATKNWATVLLVAGACLGVGFVFGILFGYPLSSGSPSRNGASTPERNLFQQSADSLSKLVAGATLVEIGKIYKVFQDVARDVSKCAQIGCCRNDEYVFGAAVTLYFLVLGFLAGLLLPNFYKLITAVPEPDAHHDGGGKDDGEGEETPPQQSKNQ
jgi:hypothetical protein